MELNGKGAQNKTVEQHLRQSAPTHLLPPECCDRSHNRTQFDGRWKTFDFVTFKILFTFHWFLALSHSHLISNQIPIFVFVIGWTPTPLIILSIHNLCFGLVYLILGLVPILMPFHCHSFATPLPFKPHQQLGPFRPFSSPSRPLGPSPFFTFTNNLNISTNIKHWNKFGIVWNQGERSLGYCWNILDFNKVVPRPVFCHWG